MPIKGVSDVVRLPRLGKIRLGILKEVVDDIYEPVPTDYFVCPDEVKKVFGEKPKELRIMFPTEDNDQWASQYYRFYSETGALLCRGDGSTATARAGVSTGSQKQAVEIVCLPDLCAFFREGSCRRVMNLQFLLPDCPGVGVYQLDTSSIHSIIAVNSGIALLRAICGRLAMIPLSLKLVEQTVEIQGSQESIYVLDLSSSCSLAEIQKLAMIPPHQALIPPIPDSEMPGDFLYCDRKATITDNRTSDDLTDLWSKVKTKVFQLNVRNEQIANWFRKNYSLDIGLSDFFLVVPPAKITYASLVHFLKVLEWHAEQL